MAVCLIFTGFMKIWIEISFAKLTGVTVFALGFMAKPLWIISYDIACPKRLRKIQKYCAENGWQMQKSIYILALSRKERESACDELTEIIDLNEDKLLCLPFVNTEGSFHLMPENTIIMTFSDERLEGFAS